ncbi:MAG: cupin domain-containing protein [Deltaproteobacteria bacterium]|nr:cupin domain-containing protein [Deltaproteobacteria bacterium]
MSVPETEAAFLIAIDAVQVSQGEDRFRLRPSMYFAGAGPFLVSGGRALLIVAKDQPPPLRQLGGPIEPTGRLRYIDGCSDTLLVCPSVRGQACLNHLHVPPGTHQSAHTHPSDRIGVIVRGRGSCVLPSARRGEGTARHIPLEPGLPFWIAPLALHCFETSEESLDVLTWHPDSDFGPTHEDHPMINRTYLRQS